MHTKVCQVTIDTSRSPPTRRANPAIGISPGDPQVFWGRLYFSQAMAMWANQRRIKSSYLVGSQTNLKRYAQGKLEKKNMNRGYKFQKNG